jgi:hypothetical protein
MNADGPAQIVDLVLRDDAVAQGVDDRSRHRRLRRSEHLDGLNGPSIVTLLDMIVSGFAGRLGATTAKRLVWPSRWLIRASAKALPTGPSFEPMRRST